MDKPSDLFILSDHFMLPTNIVVHLRRLNRAHIDLCSILEHINNVYQVTDIMYNIVLHRNEFADDLIYTVYCINLKVLILLSIITCILSMLPHLFVVGIIMAYSNFRITPQISMVIWPLHYMMKVYIVCKAASIASNEVIYSHSTQGLDRQLHAF